MPSIAREVVGDRMFAVALGDCVLGSGRRSDVLVRMMHQSQLDDAQIGIAFQEVAGENVDRYGIADPVELDPAEPGSVFRLRDLIEKPDPRQSPSNLAIAGRYLLSGEVFAALESTARGVGNEIQLTDALSRMIRSGATAFGVRLQPDEQRFDVGDFPSYFRAAAEFARVDERHAGQRVESHSCGLIKTHAFARAGLLGNPSDGFGGKTISCIIRNWAAEVTLRPAEGSSMRIDPGDDEDLIYNSLTDFVAEVERHGYYGGVRILKAAIKRFCRYVWPQGGIPPRGFEIEYRSTIPRQLGLGGSSALVIATLRALAQFFQVDLPSEWMPSLALSVETKELKIPAGLQDRVVQCHEGLVYMDFSPAASQRDGELTRGTYQSLDPELLPPLYLAFTDSESEPTEVVHGNLRQRFDEGDAAVRAAMERFAEIAQAGRAAVEREDTGELHRLMNENFDLRRSICPIHPHHLRMIEAARSLGLSAKFCGSGGAIVGILTDDRLWMPLVDAMHAIDCHVIRPQIMPADRTLATRN